MDYRLLKQFVIVLTRLMNHGLLAEAATSALSSAVETNILAVFQDALSSGSSLCPVLSRFLRSFFLGPFVKASGEFQIAFLSRRLGVDSIVASLSALLDDRQPNGFAGYRQELLDLVRAHSLSYRWMLA